MCHNYTSKPEQNRTEHGTEHMFIYNNYYYYYLWLFYGNSTIENNGHRTTNAKQIKIKMVIVHCVIIIQTET